MNDGEKKSLPYKLGVFASGVIATCIVVCGCSILLVLTSKFISWILSI